MTSTRVLLPLLLLLGCTNRPPDGTVMMGNGIGPFRGLRALPRQLAFTCVTPGCDTTLLVKVQSTVNRRVAIKRVILSKASAEYALAPSQTAPFILGAAADFGIDVRYTPQAAPSADDLKVLVTYTDASPDESDPDRLEPGELEIPIVRRLVGEPALAVNPGKLTFGLVPTGTSKELPITVSNAGFGNIALALDQSDAGHPWVSVTLPAMTALVPDAGVPVPVRFSPATRGYYRGDVVIGSSTPAVGEVTFEVEGTSFIDGVIALEPEERAIDFGDVPRRQRRTVTVQLANLGGQSLFVSGVSVRDLSNNVRASLPNAMQNATLMPLTRLPITIELDASMPGQVDATLVIASTDVARPSLEIPIRGTVTEPRLTVNPTMLAWGSVPLSWQVARPLELQNTGFGNLTVRRITFVGGTSNLYSLKNVPALPATIATGGRAVVEVEFRADTMATFGGELSIETDDPVNTIVTIPLSATGASCNQGCMVANATPSCMNGTCGIASCNMGYHNTDGMLSNGCECQELGMDPAAFCSMGVYKGVLRDTSGGSAQHTGMVPTEDDVDWVGFYAEDANNVFGDDFDVRINLTASDPNIVMCVYRQRSTARQGLCSMNEATCDIRSYRKDGSLGTDDGADFDIKVYRRANSAPTCTTYSLSMQNG
ncbi:MAG: choice-of-anchor D domain-containing protein [Myxococcaceae bacterium]|nr:choice-of-anchor D domain-containing protein [Myxococcaceae bacterium]